MSKLDDLTGRRFGRLVVIERFHDASCGSRSAKWKCRCDCGNISTPDAYKLKNGETRSCGCYRAEVTGDRARKHGMRTLPEYRIWNQMKQRCSNPNRGSYEDYGARGVVVCAEWADSFEVFYRDMGQRPSPRHTIERKDNDDGYNKRNCVWATRDVQANNTRRVRFFTINGIRLTMKQWCDKLHLNYWTIRSRLDKGVAPEVAFELTVRNP